jgi:hypothetical protein
MYDQSLQAVISSNVASIGTSAVQISGSTGVLSGVAAGYAPSYFRSVMRVTNNSTSATIYLGSTAGVTASSGWFKKLAPGEYFDDVSNGSMDRWVIADTASTPVNIDEYAGV